CFFHEGKLEYLTAIAYVSSSSTSASLKSFAHAVLKLLNRNFSMSNFGGFPLFTALIFSASSSTSRSLSSSVMCVQNARKSGVLSYSSSLIFHLFLAALT